jgi:putative sigma-54 modulation protein
MKIVIKSTKLDLTPTIEDYAKKKLETLQRFLKKFEKESELEMFVEISKTTRHHHKGDIFYAELNLSLPKKMIRIEEYHSDIYAAIDVLKDRTKAEISKLKSKIIKKRK